MKKIVLILAIVAMTASTFAQTTKSSVTVNVGAATLFPIGKSVDVKTPSYGETVKVVCTQKNVGYTLSATYLQDKANSVQIPIMAGLEFRLFSRLSFSTEAGVNFYNYKNAQFVYSPSLTYRIKNFSITESFMSTLGGGHTNFGSTSTNVGLSVTYKL
jgi:outer membrane protein W